jgi:hypothetical protein
LVVLAVTSTASTSLSIAVLAFDVTVQALGAVSAGFEGRKLEGTSLLGRNSGDQRGDGESQSYEGGRDLHDDLPKSSVHVRMKIWLETDLLA